MVKTIVIMPASHCCWGWLLGLLLLFLFKKKQFTQVQCFQCFSRCEMLKGRAWQTSEQEQRGLYKSACKPDIRLVHTKDITGWFHRLDPPLWLKMCQWYHLLWSELGLSNHHARTNIRGLLYYLFLALIRHLA